jgi:transposase InsO family protein
MKERTKFLLEWERQWREGRGRVNMAALCRMFGVSRQTGYVWVGRYVAEGHKLDAVSEGSRRAHHLPHAVSEELVDFIVRARKHRPTWGPRKLVAWLREARPDLPLPGTTAIGRILRQHGLTGLRRRRRQAAPREGAPGLADTANAVWCIDFKGWFRTGDGTRCYPLTLIDAHTRFLLRCEGLLDPTGPEVQVVLESAFAEYGLPDAIRSDNGPPFASVGAGGLTPLAVWLLKLGIRLDRGRPGKPQDNGRLERFHRTLKLETASPPRASRSAQQRAFDIFRRVYNHERPHEALGMKRPSSLYRPSGRRFPRPLKRFVPDFDGEACLVEPTGHIRWRRHRIFVSTALAREFVGLWPDRLHRVWTVTFGPVQLGRFDLDHLDRGLILPRRRRKLPLL